VSIMDESEKIRARTEARIGKIESLERRVTKPGGASIEIDADEAKILALALDLLIEREIRRMRAMEWAPVVRALKGEKA
jgi:hypothetical protein